MPSLFNKMISFARSSQGQQVLSEAEKLAQNPKLEKEAEQVAAQAAKKV